MIDRHEVAEISTKIYALFMLVCSLSSLGAVIYLPDHNLFYILLGVMVLGTLYIVLSRLEFEVRKKHTTTIYDNLMAQKRARKFKSELSGKVTYSAPGAAFLFGEHSVVYGHIAVCLPVPLRVHSYFEIINGSKVEISLHSFAPGSDTEIETHDFDNESGYYIRDSITKYLKTKSVRMPTKLSNCLKQLKSLLGLKFLFSAE